MMTDRKTPVIGYAVLGLVAIAGVVFVARASQSEAGFCRAVFNGLANGRPSVEQRIAWERLTALGVNVGETYTKLPDEKQRADYRQAFIAQFARGFQQGGGRPRDFVRWRVERRDGRHVVIAADYPAKKKTLLMGIPASGPKQLETIQWQNADFR